MDGLRFIKETKIPLAELRCQYIAPIFVPEFWPGDNLSVANSPHVDLLRIYQKHGPDFDKLWKSRYVQLFEHWNKMGFHKRDRTFIVSKVDRLTAVYNSIKKKGFKKEFPIEVLREPLWKTRYNGTEPFLNSYEIWHGHHRAAACHVLGIDIVRCRVSKDIAPGSMSCERIDKRLRKLKNG